MEQSLTLREFNLCARTRTVRLLRGLGHVFPLARFDVVLKSVDTALLTFGE